MVFKLSGVHSLMNIKIKFVIILVTVMVHCKKVSSTSRRERHSRFVIIYLLKTVMGRDNSIRKG